MIELLDEESEDLEKENKVFEKHDDDADLPSLMH